MEKQQRAKNLNRNPITKAIQLEKYFFVGYLFRENNEKIPEDHMR